MIDLTRPSSSDLIQQLLGDAQDWVRHEKKHTTAVMRVTPAMAAYALEHNDGPNRFTNQAFVDRYADDMKNGRWVLTHQGIAFDPQGLLLDGRHRLWAIVQSGTAVTLQVTFGGVDDIRHECDGGNTRRPGQTAFIAQQIDPTHPLRGMVHTQASAAVSYAATANMLEVNKASARIIPSGAVRDLLEKYKASLRWAVANLRSVNRSIWSVPVAGALVYAHHVSPVATEAFGAQVRTGIGLQVNSPALVLRDYLTGGANREYHKRRYAEDRTVIAIKTLTAAWHAEHGRSLGRLHASETALRYYRELAGDA